MLDFAADQLVKVALVFDRLVDSHDILGVADQSQVFFESLVYLLLVLEHGPQLQDNLSERYQAHPLLAKLVVAHLLHGLHRRQLLLVLEHFSLDQVPVL